MAQEEIPSDYAEPQAQADNALQLDFGYQPVGNPNPIFCRVRGRLLTMHPWNFQVFKREFGYLLTFSFAFGISGLFATTATTFVYPLQAGGPSSVIWCWLLSGIGCMCMACSVAELVSVYPTSAGVYFTVSRLAPQKWVAPISWAAGWTNLLGQIAGVASGQYGAAQLLLAAVSMGLDFNWQASTGVTVGVMAALTVVTGAVNSLPTGWIKKMTKTYAIFHMLVLFSCAIALLIKSEPKHDSGYVFGGVESHSGWTPLGFSFLFGSNNLKLKPHGQISVAMGVTFGLGFLFNIVLCYCMGNAETLLASPIQQPVAQIFYNSLGKSGGLFYTLMAFIILQFVAFTATHALTRLLSHLAAITYSSK
ncbi:uncharacterized protein BDV14DRAFT_202804 [Aspergillus stella-maris]|uniref:uncharacterized protein n=1 Tax=Aspergillus stella-maris TaxID=1810926 RepID=UPI003CCD25A6